MSGGERGDVQGWVEQLDEVAGVVGWVVDPIQPERVLTVELWAGNAMLAQTETGGSRPDVVEIIGYDTSPGFRFPGKVGDVIRAAAARGGFGDLSVRVAGSRAALPSLGGPRTLELVRLGGSFKRPASREMLLDRLSLHMTTATKMLVQPLRPAPERSIGFVELMAVDSDGLVWLSGWTNDDAIGDRPLVVLDNSKQAAGFACAFAPRADLPPGAKAFVGILQTEWRPSPTLLPFFFLCDGTARHLNCLTPVPLRRKSEIAAVALDTLACADSGYPDLLRAQFREDRSWAITPPAMVAERVGIDEVAILPGFGAFVSGWALSPTRDWTTLALKVGSKAMVADEQTLTRRPRTDLANIYPGADRATAGAGFHAVFRGDIDADRVEEMVLRTVWRDGSGTNVAITPQQTRVLGTTAPLDQVRNFYPAIEAEPFFADFAHHAAAAARLRATAVTVFAREPAARCVILVAPSVRSDAYLLFENAARDMAELPADDGVVVLARADDNRAAIISLFTDLRRASGRPCSLFFVTDVAAAAYAIEAIADELGFDRFAFAGNGVILTAAGWRAAAEAASGLQLFEVIDPAADPARARTGRVGLDAFACTRAEWAMLAHRLPSLLDGPGAGTLPAAIRDVASVVPAAGLALRDPSSPSFVRRINAAIASYHE